MDENGTTAPSPSHPWQVEVEVSVPVSLPEPVLGTEELNQEFYSGYPADFFEHSLMLALAALKDPNKALESVHTETTIRFGEGENVLQIAVGDLEPQEVEDYRMLAKLQVESLCHHALEVLVRLFLAHAPEAACPWVELVRAEGPGFTKKLKGLAEITPEWTGENAEDEHFRLAFFPEADPRPEVRVGLSHTKAWIAYAATHSMRRSRPYHSLKHGISVRTGTPTFAMYEKDRDPRVSEDAVPFARMKGQSLTYLTRRKGSDGNFDWFMEHSALQVSLRAAIVFQAQKLIRTLLTVGKMRFVTRPDEFSDPLWLPPSTPEEMSAKVMQNRKADPVDFVITQSAIPLGVELWPPKQRG